MFDKIAGAAQDAFCDTQKEQRGSLIAASNQPSARKNVAGALKI